MVFDIISSVIDIALLYLYLNLFALFLFCFQNQYFVYFLSLLLSHLIFVLIFYNYYLILLNELTYLLFCPLQIYLKFQDVFE